jgi:hypothetical protein
MDVTQLMSQCRNRFDSANDAEWLASITLIEREPINPDRFYRLAELCRERGYDDLWRGAASIALRLPHVTYKQIFQRGEIKLTLGDWSGWLDREARLFDPAHPTWHSEYWRKVRWTRRPWDGTESLGDKTIFVIADGSHSECLRMMRYVPLVASRAARVVLGVSADLCTLVQHNLQSAVTVVSGDVEHSIPFQRYAWIASLPAILGDLPPFESLRAPIPVPRTEWDPSRLQVGLCWTEKHVPLNVLQPLLDRPDIQWHSLQVDDCAQTDANHASLIRPTQPLSTFADAANYVMSLDCVLSVCSAVAHLSAGLGIPTLVMLPSAADAMWGLADTTPWYPSIRLMRQSTPGDWSSVVEAVAKELDSRRPSRRA